MSGLVEQASSAIENEFDELADPTGSVSAYGIADRVVRAVLRAIREPTSGMLGEAHDIILYSVKGEELSVARAVWKRMIDAALERS